VVAKTKIMKARRKSLDDGAALHTNLSSDGQMETILENTDITAELVRNTERFVPEVLMKKIIYGKWKPMPSCDAHVGVVMLADISGYTALAEKLSNSTGP
jgi:hypothetical protein